MGLLVVAFVDTTMAWHMGDVCNLGVKQKQYNWLFEFLLNIVG